MIIVQVMGNLGNQLFIYAMARALQLEYGDDIVFDLGGLKRFYYSSAYRLDSFNLPQSGITTDTDLIPRAIWWKYKLYSKTYHVEQKIYRKLRRNALVPQIVNERWFKRGCYFNFNRLYHEYKYLDKKNRFVYGYFQSAKYFDKYKEKILEDLEIITDITDEEKQIIQEIESCESVAVSMRAINEIGVSFIKFDYYYRAIDLIAQKLNNPHFFVFSDDVEEVKSKCNFSYPVTYVMPKDSISGLKILSSCKHFIIANSTFSWWGTYLSRNANKIIIMPDKIDDKGPVREDYYFDDAIRIECEFEKYKLDIKQIKEQNYAK